MDISQIFLWNFAAPQRMIETAMAQTYRHIDKHIHRTHPRTHAHP